MILLSFFIFASCEKTLFEAEPFNDAEAIFEEMWTTFNIDYDVFDVREINWQSQYDQYRPMVNTQTSSEELAEICKDMLGSLDDGHVSLTIPHKRIFYSNKIVEQEIDNHLFDLDLIQHSYLEVGFKESGEGGNTYGWIGNVGYLHLDFIGANMLLMDEILNYFQDANGLIVDLRHNGGGDFSFAFTEFGRFTDEKRYVYRSNTKNGPGPQDFTEWFEWNINPAGKYFDKPIIVLTDRYTISAGERMLMAFKTLPNVQHMGDTTNGAFRLRFQRNCLMADILPYRHRR